MRQALAAAEVCPDPARTSSGVGDLCAQVLGVGTPPFLTRARALCAQVLAAASAVRFGGAGLGVPVPVERISDSVRLQGPAPLRAGHWAAQACGGHAGAALAALAASGASALARENGSKGCVRVAPCDTDSLCAGCVAPCGTSRGGGGAELPSRPPLGRQMVAVRCPASQQGSTHEVSAEVRLKPPRPRPARAGRRPARPEPRARHAPR